MSQWSEKIPKENLSKTVSPTRYLFTSFSETWTQINNFRKSSKKFIIDLLTKNIALNLSGAIFFVGLGYSLKWWYKDQLFVVLLKQNLPALSESQENRETGKSILNDEYQTWTPLIDRIDLDANHICIKFKQPWQKHFYEQFVGVFGEPAQVNISKQTLKIPFTREKDWWKEDSSVINNLTAYPQLRVQKKPSTKMKGYANSFQYPKPLWGPGVKGSRGKQIENLACVDPVGVRGIRSFAKGIKGKELPDELKKNTVVTKRNFANRKDNFFSYNSTSPVPLQGVRSKGLKKSCDSKRNSEGIVLTNLVNKFSTYTLYTYTQKKPIFPKKLFKLSPHNLGFLNQNSLLTPEGYMKDLQEVPTAGAKVIPMEFLLNTKQRSLFSKAWALPASARFHPIQMMSIEDLPDLQGAPRANARVYPLQPLFGARAVTRVNWGSCRSKASVAELRVQNKEPKDFSKSFTFPLREYKYPDKLSYPLQLTKKLAGWQPFPNLLVLNSYLDEIPYKLESTLQSYFPRKNSQLLFLSTSFRQSINSRNKFLMWAAEPTKMNPDSIFPTKMNPYPEGFNLVEGSRGQESILVEGSRIHFSGAINNSYSSKKNSEEITLAPTGGIVNDFFLKKNTFNKVVIKSNSVSTLLCKASPSNSSVLHAFTQKVFTHYLPLQDLLHKSDKSKICTICNSWQNKEGLLPHVLLWVQEQKNQKLTEEQLLYPSGVSKQEEPLANSDANLPFALPFVKAREILSQREKLVIKELETESADVKAHRGLLYKSKNSWVSGASANYKNSETKNNETEKTLDLFKEMFLVPGKQNEQSETYLKKLHLFETKKLLQNQLTSLINSFPILNGGLLDISKKILEVKRNTLKKAIDPGVKGQYLPSSFTRYSKSLIYNSCSFQYPLPPTKMNPYPIPHTPSGSRGPGVKGSRGTQIEDLACVDPVGVRGVRSKEGAINGANDTNNANDANLRFARFALFVPKESVAERYWDTEVYRLTQLFAYSTVANAGDAKGPYKVQLRYPLLLLNTLGFTFNNLSPLTNPPIFSSSENKINVIDKDINFDKNSRYMSGYIYPDIESNSLKTFVYPWLGKNKNLMLSPLREYKYHYLNDKPVVPGFAYPSGFTLVDEVKFRHLKNLESNYNSHDSLLQQHNDNLLRSHENNPTEDQLVRSLTQLSCASKRDPSLLRVPLDHEGVWGNRSSATLVPYEINSSLIGNKEKKDPLGNSHYMDNIEIPYEKFNHYLAKFPGFSNPTQFFTTLPQIACGNENLVNESSILGQHNSDATLLQGRGTKNLSKINLDLFETEKKIEHVDPFTSVGVRKKISSSNIVDKSEINKKFIQKNGCNSRKVAYSGIVVRRNKKTKDFQPFNFKNPRFVKKCKELNFGNAAELRLPPPKMNPYPEGFNLVEGSRGTQSKAQRFSVACGTGSSALAKSSIWGALFLGPENPLTNRQCHFFGQKQLSTLDTKSLQRDYLRELGKEILTQSNLKGYTEFSKFSSIERTKILSLSKKVNSFFFKKRKYSYLLEPKDQWHLLFQEQLCSALEDCKKYPLSTIHSFEETNMARLDSGRIKVSAPLIMARFPKKLVQFRSIHDTECETKGYKLEQGISWRPLCHLQKSFIYTPLKDNSLLSSFETPIARFSRNLPLRGYSYPPLKCTHTPNPLPLGGTGFILVEGSKGTQIEDLACVDPVGVRGFISVGAVARENQIFVSYTPSFNKSVRSSAALQNLDYYHLSYSTSSPLFNLNIPVATHNKPSPNSLTQLSPMQIFDLQGAPPASARVIPPGFAYPIPPTKMNPSGSRGKQIEDLACVDPVGVRGFISVDEAQLRYFLSRYASSSNVALVSSKSTIKNRELLQQEYPHYPLFTERFSEEINALPYLNKNSLFYSATDSPAVTNGSEAELRVAERRSQAPAKMNPGLAYPSGFTLVDEAQLRYPNLKNRRALLRIPPTKMNPRGSRVHFSGGSEAALPFVTQKNMKNNLVGVQNMCNSLLIQEPLNCNSWAVLNQWVFLIALLFWIEQTLLNHVFPALFALEQILLSAAGLRTGENNRTHVLRISKNETPKFQNLAGIDGLLGELSELVLFLRGQRNLGVAKLSFWNKWNKKNSYGVLLTGSPGTGKTFLVRALANEANVPVLILSASTLTASKLNNNKPSWSIRHAFKRAKQLAPCILFIDEIDALGKSRGKIVTDINEIVVDSATSDLTSASHKRIFAKSTHNNSASLQHMFSYEQFGQNSSNFNATLLNKWEYPLQSTILQECNEINENSLCQEKLVDLLKIAGGGRVSIRNSERTSYPLRGMELGTIESTPSGKESAAEFKESSSSDIDNKGVLPTLEKEMTRGKFGPLTQLLVSMDGVSSFSGVLIMGATNRPELLDPALTRPGRFEKTIRIDKPSEQNRIEILQLYSQNLGVQQQIPWSYLATRTIGLTTADLAVAMNYSSLRAIIQDSVHTLETIEYGLNCITRL